MLGCDAVNLSLGAPNPGNTRHEESIYQAILDKLASSDIVVTISAGNSGAWPTLCPQQWLFVCRRCEHADRRYPPVLTPISDDRLCRQRRRHWCIFYRRRYELGLRIL